MRLIVIVLALAACGGAAGPLAAQTRIDWQLENPFRLFKKPAHFRQHAETFAALKPHERATPILSAERALATASGGRGWAEGMFNDTCYNQTTDAYDACKDYVVPKSHRIVARLLGTSAISWADLFRDRTTRGTCRWRLLTQAGKAIAAKSADCTRPVTFDVPWPGGARLSVTRDGGDPAAPSALVKVRDVMVIAMGDSFGAGEGNPDDPIAFNDARGYDYGTVDIAETGRRERLDGFPAREGNWRRINTDSFDKYRARWWDRECHRSLYSHQFRVALQLAVENPKRAVTFVSFACTGSEINDGLFVKKPVRECTAGEAFTVPAQFGDAARALCKTPQTGTMPQSVLDASPELKARASADTQLTRCKPARAGSLVTAPGDLKRPIDLVLLSVGGNDSGFVALVSDSLLSDGSIYRKLGRRMGQIYDAQAARARLAMLRTRFSSLKVGFETLFGLSAAKGQQKRVILTAYPHMGYSETGMQACSGNKGLEVFPAFRLDQAKVAAAEDFTTELNTTMAGAAASWTYVDGHRADFRKHGLCATAPGGGTSNILGFPRLQDGVWTPYKPSEFRPYTPRQRWHRTPNDAFLIANMHSRRLADFGQNCSGVISDPLSKVFSAYWTPFQVFLASTYGGAFHPTAEGQARIADDALIRARAIVGTGVARSNADVLGLPE